MDDVSSQHSLFSKDPRTLDFDLSAGNVWIYPENYPLREYQFNIVKNALYHNTLVCLPTGLGKTFIAAVVMYNFWRWYPKGKVVFLAPTKPLVAQQMNACHEIMGIPTEETVELTGTTNQKQREIAWVRKRVIFATPQTFHKDLEKNIFPTNRVKCIVIDEAHKALGKHSYCESIRLLSAQNNYFRVLALSATPGDKISKVHEVVSNLHISNLELRDETSEDIAPYVNERKLDIILVRLSDELAKFKERYITIMDPHVRLLVRLNVLKGDAGNICKGRIFHLTREFQSKSNKSGNYGQIMKTLNILLTMYHAYELMIRHGLRAFLHFYENHSDKFWMEHEINLHDLLQDIKNYLGPFPVIAPLPDGSVPDIPNNLIFGHNKFYKLKELLECHFKSFRNKNQDTRAIVFVEYRDIVNEVHVLLLQCRPLIRPQMFVGQAGQKQRQQIRALENFRNNKVNVLISTSVGEEGLDVGEVDLIICFDISQSSPIRLVQRMGRTGRQRNGHIIALVTDGKEHQSLKTTMLRKDSLNNKVLQSSNIASALYEESPRMVPNEYNPECRKIYIKVQLKTPKVKGARKKREYEKKNKQNTEPETVEREIDTKSRGQSSMDRFFKAKKSNERNVEFDISFISQTQQNIKTENIKLLLSDKENVDFLTLYAMRNSRSNFHVLDTGINTTYIPSYPPKDLKFLSSFTLPDLSILDCLSSLQSVKILEQKEKNLNISSLQNCEEYLLSKSFEGLPDTHFKELPETHFEDLSKTHFKKSEVTIERSFVDLIYDSSSSDEVTIFEDKSESNRSECIGKFDDLLNETTDESENEEISLIGYRKKEHNFSNLFEDASFESEFAQDKASSVILDNKIIINEKNQSTQQNDSRDISFTSLTSNCTGMTITQVIEEVRQMNGNKLSSNNSLTNSQGNTDIQLTKDVPNNSANQLKTIKLNKSDVQDAELQRKQLQFQISNSDDDLFDIEVPDASAMNDSTHNSDTPEVSSTLDKPIQNKIFPTNECQIVKLESNKSVSIAKKENSSLNHNEINNVDWKSDFEISTNAVDGQDYFKNDEGLKIESSETSWISCIKKSNATDNNNVVPLKKLSLFTRNRPSTTENANIDKINNFTDLNKSCSKEKDNDDSDFDIFKKPVNKLSGISSSRKVSIKAQLASRVKLNEPSAPLNEKQTIILESEGRNEKLESHFDSSLEQSPKIKNKKTKIRRHCQFIDNEAEVSMNEGDTSEGTSGEDEDLEDFVSYTQDVSDNVDMRIHYLNSIKSPVKRPGAFLIKKPVHFREDVYSQPMSQLNDTYLSDSFCVKEDEIEYNEESEDESEITCLQVLEEGEKKRKRCTSPIFQVKRKKRRKGRIQIADNESSSEDEMENIRKQIQEESFLLKHRN